ncbi:MAG: peptidylprolyl isomerase [Rhizobiales bacterium]|nr:peptidylprolyl isomerase [Hyphomicrobiales bacterium]
MSTKATLAALIMTLCVSTALVAPSFAQDATDPKAVVATVGDINITEQVLTIALDDLADVVADVADTDKRARMVDILIDMHLFAQEARAAKLQETDTFALRLQLMEARALRNAYFADKILSGVSDDDVKARYEQEVAKIEPEEMISARHILVETEEEAKQIITDLQGGADFQTLAKERSTGPSGPQGGDLGEFRRGQMVPPFEEAAFALEAGNITTTPVKTDFGWHVIEVYNKKTAPLPTLEQVTEQIRNLVVSERFTAELERLRTKYKVEHAQK